MYHSYRKDTLCLTANGANCVDKAGLGDPAFVQLASGIGPDPYLVVTLGKFLYEAQDLQARRRRIQSVW